MSAPGTVAALFAGIGGIERGLSRSGFRTTYLCEAWEPAQEVLAARFPDVPLAPDIRELKKIPPADVVAGGFPCVDLSQAGMTAGIAGSQSGLVLKALELVENHPAKWVLLENVRNMLPLHGGRAMAAITGELDRMGFRWAYRVVDSRFSGVPQRRQRVLLLASRKEDPRAVLFADDVGELSDTDLREDAYGFYSTEGLRGLGWCRDGVPTLKGGSSIGIPSPPAIWLPDASPEYRFVVPGIASAERLQGFPKDWTKPGGRRAKGAGARWKLVGNAVTVGVSEWLGRRLVSPGDWDPTLSSPLSAGSAWPLAAWGERGRAWKVDVTMWPQRKRYKHLRTLLGDDYAPLSNRAAAGFLSRLDRGNLRAVEDFRLDLKEYVAARTAEAA
jgi:DNA (cytosine-5)-methyltransferase 1